MFESITNPFYLLVPFRPFCWLCPNASRIYQFLVTPSEYHDGIMFLYSISSITTLAGMLFQYSHITSVMWNIHPHALHSLLYFDILTNRCLYSNSPFPDCCCWLWFWFRSVHTELLVGLRFFTIGSRLAVPMCQPSETFGLEWEHPLIWCFQNFRFSFLLMP